MTLRTRIAAVAGLAVALAVLASAASIYVAVRAELRGEIDDSLRVRAAAFVDRPDGPGGRPGPGRPGRGERRGPPPGAEFLLRGRGTARFGGAEGYAQFVLRDGRVQGPPGATVDVPVSAESVAIAARGEGEQLADVRVGDTPLRVLTVGVGGLGALQVARPLDEVDRQLRRVLLVLVVVGLAGIALAVAMGAAVARAALRPIGRFTARTEALAEDPDLSRRMEGAGGTDELARLARSFNATLDALERSVEAQRHLVADASHELRTPIASLRANIQTLQHAERLSLQDRESLRADVVEELDGLTALIGDVVELARGSKPEAVLDDVRLDQIVAELVERARRRSGDALRIEADLEPTVVAGEPERVSRAVSNLLDNAVKWSPPGGVVEVALRDGTLTVRDHGPGFDPEDLPRVFERFHRADRARGMPGSGLGLAIVRQAAEAHGGWASAANAEGGSGALLRVSFGPATRIGEPLRDPVGPT